MFTVEQVTKIVRSQLRNPNLNVESWSHQVEDLDGNDSVVYRIQGYATDLIAYFSEGTPVRFDIRFSPN